MNIIYPYVNTGIYTETCGSDHTPLWLDVVLEL